MLILKKNSATCEAMKYSGIESDEETSGACVKQSSVLRCAETEKVVRPLNQLRKSASR